MKNLSGKISIVTGGSRGIGAGIVRKLAEEGAIVAFTFLRATDKARAIEAEVNRLGGKALAFRADAANCTEMATVVEEVVRRFGKVDILVNNAGIFKMASINDPNQDVQALANMWRINVLGIAQTIRIILPYLKEGGRIISIGSGAADRSPFEGIGDYSATKAALAGYTRGWARDLASRNICVNVVQPGLIDTDLKPDDQYTIANMLKPVALKRFGTLGEIGNVVAFLASDKASYITGATITVDGGLSA